MHRELLYSQSESSVSFDRLSTRLTGNVLIVGVTSGFGSVIRKDLERIGLRVITAGRSGESDLFVDLTDANSTENLARVCRRENVKAVIVTAATAFLDSSPEDFTFDTAYLGKLHLNGLFLLSLARGLDREGYRPQGVIVFTSEAGWSGGPSSHIHYNISKAILNATVLNMSEAYGISVVGIDPGEARSKMNKESVRDPREVLPMIRWILSRLMSGEANMAGKFFHSDGRSLTFCKSGLYREA